ncbi:MAG: hypothetical protein LBK94_03395 [Prevotellaceae bacterium]|jgi:hypothetical protein|nr:hypothetical protein [Prevotellaceae bacterium]
MKKIIYLAMTLCIAAGLILVSCDKANNDDDLNDSLNFNGTASSIGFVGINDIPAEYDSVGMIYNNHYTAISLALIRKGFDDPTNDEIIYVTKEYFKSLYHDFDTTVLDNVNITDISDGMDSFNSDQQKIVSKINNLLETASSASAFVQQIPTMVTYIYTLPSEDREQVFIYLAIAKHAALDRSIITSELALQGFWGKVFTRFCAMWGIIHYATGGLSDTHPLGAGITAGCAVYALLTLT